jgi:NADH dehydrogenase FAD-containing subunit
MRRTDGPALVLLQFNSHSAFQRTKTAAGIIARLGLQARVTVLDADMVGLDRAARAIALSNGVQLNYDFLVITCGLQEPTASTFAHVGPL